MLPALERAWAWRAANLINTLTGVPLDGHRPYARVTSFTDWSSSALTSPTTYRLQFTSRGN